MKQILCLCSLSATLAALGCSAPEHRVRPAPDCAEEQRYDLLSTPTYNSAGLYYSAPNPGTPDPVAAKTTMEAGMLGPEAFCGHTTAVVFKTQGNHDWGSLVGTYPVPPDTLAAMKGMASTLTPADMDASGYEGLSFWARGRYDRSISINLEDATVNQAAEKCVPAEIITDEDMNGVEDPGTYPTTNRAFYDKYGRPVADGCNLTFSVGFIPTEWWSFYTIPFNAFTQGGNEPDARRRPEGIDRSTISRVVIRAPKDTFVENWFVNFAWYRARE